MTQHFQRIHLQVQAKTNANNRPHRAGHGYCDKKVARNVAPVQLLKIDDDKIDHFLWSQIRSTLYNCFHDIRREISTSREVQAELWPRIRSIHLRLTLKRCMAHFSHTGHEGTWNYLIINCVSLFSYSLVCLTDERTVLLNLCASLFHLHDHWSVWSARGGEMRVAKADFVIIHEDAYLRALRC